MNQHTQVKHTITSNLVDYRKFYLIVWSWNFDNLHTNWQQCHLFLHKTSLRSNSINSERVPSNSCKNICPSNLNVWLLPPISCVGFVLREVVRCMTDTLAPVTDRNEWLFLTFHGRVMGRISSWVHNVGKWGIRPMSSWWLLMPCRQIGTRPPATTMLNVTFILRYITTIKQTIFDRGQPARFFVIDGLVLPQE